MKKHFGSISFLLVVAILVSIVQISLKVSAVGINIDGERDASYSEDKSFVIDKQFTTAGGSVVPNNSGVTGKVYYTWDSNYLYFYISSASSALFVDLRVDPDPKIGNPADGNPNTSFNPNLQTDAHIYFRVKSDGTFENRTGGAKAQTITNNYYVSKNNTDGYIVEFKCPRTYGSNQVDTNSFKFSVALGLSTGVVAIKNNWVYFSGLTEVMLPQEEEELNLPTYYGNGMLFQRGKPIVLCGTAQPGHDITIKMFDENNLLAQATTTVLDDHSWKASLPSLPGGYTKYSIQLFDNNELENVINDVVIGELWLSSGQSNMQYMMSVTPSAQDILANPTDEYLRYLNMPSNPIGINNAGNVPFDAQTNINGAYWSNGKNKTALRSLSAVAYYFASKLREELNMPVGILNTALGSTSIYTWLSHDAIEHDNTVKSYLQSTGRYLTQSNWNQAGNNNFNQMGAMYNQKIAPLTNLNISGMIWYQGETNSNEPSGSYQAALNLLLHDYSTRFGFDNDSMPLIYAHLATHFYGRSLEQTAIFAEDLSNAWRDHPENMAQIPIYDIAPDYKYSEYITGASGDVPIHPYSKQPVGEQMAQAALGMVYSKSTEYSAPVYKSVSVSGNSLIVQFDHVGSGLAAKPPSVNYTVNPNDNSFNGFAISGADGIYVPAKAQIISNDKVKVWNDTVKYPVSVTYAFTEMNMNSNLVSTMNGQTLFAAAPFRTLNLTNANYNHPNDWMNCNLPKIWHSNASNGNYHDAWQAGVDTDASITLSYDPLVKSEGYAGLKVAYSTGLNQSFGVSPTTIDPAKNSPFVDTNTNFSKFSTLSFDVKNNTGRPLTYGELAIKGSDNAWYRPYVLDTTGFNKSLGSENGWQTITLDLTKLNKVGADASQIFPVSNLNRTSNIKFTFYDTTVSAGSTGEIYLDNFVFGFKTDKAEINKQALLTVLETTLTVDLSHYTDASVSAYNTKLSTAKSVMNNTSATQGETNTATQELSAAINALVLKTTDKTALQAAINTASAIDLTKYTDVTAAAVTAKLNAAQSVMADSNATKSQVDTATQELSVAINALVLKTVDKTALQAAINTASAIDLTKYTNVTATALTTKLNAAQSVMADSNATKSQVDTATQELSAAIEALEQMTINWAALQAEINTASAIDLTKYTDATAAAVTAKLNSAKTVLADANATELQVDTAVQELVAAVNSLVLKQNTGKTSSTDQQGSNNPDTSDSNKFLLWLSLFALLLIGISITAILIKRSRTI